MKHFKRSQATSHLPAQWRWRRNTPSRQDCARCASTFATAHQQVKLQGTHAGVGAKQQDTDCLRRTFIKRAYPVMKKSNPSIPILIREATGVSPKVWARYGRRYEKPTYIRADTGVALGKEKAEELTGMLPAPQEIIWLTRLTQDCQTRKSRTRSQVW